MFGSKKTNIGGGFMFYDILKALCEERGLTITSFSVQMGGSKGSPSNWKRGALPNTDIVLKAADFFGVSTDYLMGRTRIRETALMETEKENLYSQDEIELIDLLRSVDDNTREMALASMHAILKTVKSQKSVAILYNSQENESKNRGAV